MVLKVITVKDTMGTLNRRYSFNAADLVRKPVNQIVEIGDLKRRNSFNAADLIRATKPAEHKWWHFISGAKLGKSGHNNSTVAIRKLRESKWFKADEERLFCAVIEPGFIVEVTNDDIESKSWYGIVSVENKKSK